MLPAQDNYCYQYQQANPAVPAVLYLSLPMTLVIRYLQLCYNNNLQIHTNITQEETTPRLLASPLSRLPIFPCPANTPDWRLLASGRLLHPQRWG